MKYYVLALLMAVGLLSSCSFFQKEKGEIEYIPFKESEKGRWGMVSTDGTVLFSDEFKNEPTIAMDGRFFVKNDKGEWELYTAEEKPKQIGDSYVSVGMFCDGIAPVTRRGKAIEFIDTEGKVTFTFDKVNGKRVERMSAFLPGGIATFKLSDGKCGVINTAGKMVIEPADQLVVPLGSRIIVVEGVKLSEMDSVSGGDRGAKELVVTKGSLGIYTLSGEKVSTIKGSQIAKILDIGDAKQGFVGDKIALVLGNDENEKGGIANDQGEWVVSPTAKLKGIEYFQDDKIIYENENDEMGLMDFDGNVLIRPKYKDLYFSGKDGKLFAGKRGDEKNNVLLINEQGEKIGTDEYRSVRYPFLKDGLALVQVGEHSVAFINGDGEEQKCKADLYEVSYNTGDHSLESDYIDPAIVVEEFGITQSGVMGLSLTDSPEVLIGICNQNGASYSHDAESHTYRSVLSYTKYILGARVEVSANYTSSIAESNPVYESFGDYGEYEFYDHTEYRFNTAMRPNRIEVTVANDGKLKGKLRSIVGALKTKFGAMGRVLRQNDNAVVAKVGSRVAIAIYDGGTLTIALGDLDENFSISEYASVTERNTTENDYEGVAADSVAAYAVDPATVAAQ